MEFNDYEKVSLTTDVVVLALENIKSTNIRQNDMPYMQIMLIKRKSKHFNGMWSLPGGFVDADKSLISTAKSKLARKTSIKDIYMEQLYTYGDNITRDPRGRVISVSYLALAEKQNISIIKESADHEVEWFWIEMVRENGVVKDVQLVSESNDELHLDELAFDHKSIIIDALNRLSNKIWYTGVIFKLMPKEFTVRELQLAYYAITGKLTSNFKIIIGDKIVETGNVKSEMAHRPARLYKFNSNKYGGL